MEERFISCFLDTVSLEVLPLSKKLDVIFEKGMLKPLEELNLKDGQRLRVIIESQLFGMLRDWKVDAQKIKDELREIHG